MKKTLIITAIGALLLITGAVYFLSGHFNNADRPLFDAVPADAAFVIEFPNIKKGKKEVIRAGIWEELQAYELIQKLHGDLNFFDTFLIASLDADEDLPVLATIHKIKSDDHGILYILPATILDPDQLQRDQNPMITGSNERTYKKTKIYELRTSLTNKPVAVAIKDGLLLVSFEPFLLENALVTLENDIKKGKEFNNVYDLSGKSEDIKIFINMDQVSTFLSIYTNPEAQNYLNRIRDLADWIVIDLAFAGKSIILTGYAAASEGKILSVIGGNGTDVHIKNLLPFNTALFFYYNTNQLETLVLQDEEKKQVFNKYFKDWIGSVATYAITEPYDTAIHNDVLIFLQSKDNELAKSQLKELAAHNLNVVNIEPEQYKNFDIYQIADLQGLDKLAGFKSNNIRDPYFTVIEDHILFSNNLGNIKVLLERYIEQQTLAKDIDFLNFRKNMADHPGVNLYINTSRILHILKKVASPGFSSYLDTSFNNLKQLTPIGIQFTHYKENTFLVNGLIQASKNFQKRTNLLWKTELSATISMRPEIVMNHMTNEREILVQDDENNLYLIGKNGEVIWSRQLDSKITGSVHQVDFYVNGKLQYLFTTRESINLIDRNGDHVENFPIRMSSPITGGLAVFDYDRNNKYRMFLSCENGNIYGFEKSGKPLQGWNPRRNAGVIDHPIQYLDFEGRDYLIALNNSGKLMFFNRKGELRVPEIPLDASFDQNFVIEGKRGGTFNLYNVSRDGKLLIVQLDGNYQTDSLGDFYEPVSFVLHDVAGDETKEFIIMDDLNLMVFDINKKKIFEYALPSNIEKDIFIIENRITKDRIGLYSKSEGLIYMISESGSLTEDFPLKGNSPFAVTDLYKDGEKVVITGTKDKTITTYRLK